MHILFVRHVSRAGAAAIVALVAAGCAQAPKSPEAPVAKPAVVPRAAPPAPEDPITVATVLEVYRTQQVDRVARERCGQAIAPPPPRSLWSRMFSSPPSRDDVEMPVPVFVPQTACDEVAARRYDPAHYRVTYRFGQEVYMADLDYDPGNAVRVDGVGRVLGPAEPTGPARQP